MSEAVDTAIEINATLRVVVVCGGKWGKTRGWLLQRMVDGAWCDDAIIRSAEMLRWLVQGVDADAAAILTALPARCDFRTAAERVQKRKRPATKRAAVARPARPAGAGTNRAAAAAAFLTWRAEQKENAAKG
jgi:hypothetical protein